MNDGRSDPRGGKTLLDVLCTLAILGLMMQLLLPAVQATRESARRLQCAGRLRQLGLAATTHQQAKGYFPSGGWHFHWIGEPERGTGPAQPGSWAYNLLDYLGESELRQSGAGSSGAKRASALRTRCETPVSAFYCPSRRAVRAYPHRENQHPFTAGGRLRRPLLRAAKTDYAANVGDTPEVEFDWQWPGPQSLVEGDRPQFRWPASTFSGVIFGRSRVRPNRITDGLSKTYLIGEKYMDRGRYATGDDWGDNENLFAGFNNDNCRSSATPPRRDQGQRDFKTSFGSAHPNVWQAVFCDGSVHSLSFQIDSNLHRQLGNRRDALRRIPAVLDLPGKTRRF